MLHTIDAIRHFYYNLSTAIAPVVGDFAPVVVSCISIRHSDRHHGRFDIFYRGGWAHLVVYPADHSRSPVYVDEVQSRMRLLGVPRVSVTEIRRIVDEASGRPQRLVAWPAGERLASEIRVLPSDDGMSAAVEITPPKKGGAPPTRDEVVTALTGAGVVSGIDEGAVDDVLTGRTYDTPTIVARGRDPIHARAAEIAYHFNTNRGKPYLEMEFGRINLRELNFIENTTAGALLAQFLPPVAPRDGVTVYGTAIPADTATKPVELRAGNNVRVAEGAAYAETDGNVRLWKGAIVVEPVVTVANVNYETGNIHLDGSLVVEGEIADGFTIEATGDVQVGHGVGKATIRAGGNVLLKTGINGNNGGQIECGGNLFAKFIESSHVRTRGNLFVEEAIMHSDVSVWRHCVLNGRRAEIIASHLTVGGSVWCKKLGSIYEAPTHIWVGVHPDTLGAYRECETSVGELQRKLEKVEEQLEQLERAVRAGRREDRVVAARDQLANEKATVTADLAAAVHRLHELRSRLQASRDSFIVVEDTMFRAAAVSFGTWEYRAPEKGTRKTILRAGSDGIVESGYNPYDAPELAFDEEDGEPASDDGDAQSPG